jgi:hypothetical protein
MELFVITAILIEAVTAGLKPVWDRSKTPTWDNVAALCVAVLVSVLAGLDLYAALGVSLPAPVGAALTGVILSRGSNYMNDMLKFMRAAKTPAVERKFHV